MTGRLPRPWSFLLPSCLAASLLGIFLARAAWGTDLLPALLVPTAVMILLLLSPTAMAMARTPPTQGTLAALAYGVVPGIVAGLPAGLSAWARHRSAVASRAFLPERPEWPLAADWVLTIALFLPLVSAAAGLIGRQWVDRAQPSRPPSVGASAQIIAVAVLAAGWAVAVSLAAALAFGSAGMYILVPSLAAAIGLLVLGQMWRMHSTCGQTVRAGPVLLVGAAIGLAGALATVFMFSMAQMCLFGPCPGPTAGESAAVAVGPFVIMLGAFAGTYWLLMPPPVVTGTR